MRLVNNSDVIAPGWRFLEPHMPDRTDLRVVEMVAEHLGNTVSVCRKYYIHPSVLAAVTDHEVPPADSITKKEEKQFDGEFDAEEIVAYRICRGN